MPTYKKLRVADLGVDERYQRVLDEKNVQQIVENFDEAQLGVLEVSQRGDDSPPPKNAVFIGQHRLEALRRLDNEFAPCLVHVGLTPVEEAELFIGETRRKALSSMDVFRARLFAGDPIAEAINEEVHLEGLEIASRPGAVNAIVSAERVYRKRGNLRLTLAILKKCWAGDKDFLNARIIEGVSAFLFYYHEAETGRVVEKWSEISPTVILRRAGEYGKATHAVEGVIIALRAVYIKGRGGGGRLPPLDAVLRERRVVQRDGKKRMIRLSYEIVRDAAQRLGKFTVDELRHELGGVSRAPLVERSGYLDQLIQNNVIRMRRVGGRGPRFYEYTKPEGQPSSRTKQPPPEKEAVGEKVIQIRSKQPQQTHVHYPKTGDKTVNAMLRKAVRSGWKIETRGRSSHFYAVSPEGVKVGISNTPGDQEAVNHIRRALQDAGLKMTG